MNNGHKNTVLTSVFQEIEKLEGVKDITRKKWPYYSIMLSNKKKWKYQARGKEPQKPQNNEYECGACEHHGSKSSAFPIAFQFASESIGIQAKGYNLVA